MDILSSVLSWIAVITVAVSCFIPVPLVRSIVSSVSLAVFIYAYYRVFSRNITKRRAENIAFIGFFTRKKLRFQQRKTHKFYSCPKCKAMLRVPKGRGKIEITCKQCGTQFVKNT